MTKLAYHSAEEKTEDQAQQYLQTHQAPHRFLAYKEIPSVIGEFVKGNQALDYGAGTGASSAFLHSLGLKVIGADISLSMLKKAETSFPGIKFRNIADLSNRMRFDLVFSSFVLFELSSKQSIIQYLKKARSFLKRDGIFIGITGSSHLYSLCRDWLTFDVDFEENRKLVSGQIVKLALRSPRMEFYDYYWEEKDYLECFKAADLQILHMYFPLGSASDPYPWKDELFYSPFVVFVAQRAKKKSLL